MLYSWRRGGPAAERVARAREHLQGDMADGWPERWKALAEGMGWEQCQQCHGVGLWQPRLKFGQGWEACGCVLRAAFRRTWKRYGELAAQPGSVVMRRSWIYGRPSEEFCADVLMVSRRALADAWDWRGLRVFEMHVVAGVVWHESCRRMGLDRGTFWHEEYRIEAILGRVYVELLPYPLYPTGRYLAREACELQDLRIGGDRARRRTLVRNVDRTQRGGQIMGRLGLVVWIVAILAGRGRM